MSLLEEKKKKNWEDKAFGTYRYVGMKFIGKTVQEIGKKEEDRFNQTLFQIANCNDMIKESKF